MTHGKMPPPKMAVTVGVSSGKPKNDEGGPPRPPSMMSKAAPPMKHAEPDADQMGGPSDNDADNRFGENLDMIQQHAPELIHPIANMVQAFADYCKGKAGGGGEYGENESDEFPA